MADCIFCRIAKGEIPCEKVYEDAETIAFKDINPQAPVHIVVVPKRHVETLNDIKDFSLYGELFKAVSKITEKLGLQEKGYRVVGNCKRDGGQTVLHIHFHILGGRMMKWPPG